MTTPVSVINHPQPPNLDSSGSVAEPVLLIIADISGYTRYMTANAKTLAHSQTIITELVKALIRQIELPLEIAKLEGDAVFLFCRKQNVSRSWPESKKIIGDNLITFFRLFREKFNELSQSTTCACHACAHNEKLRLKVVVHGGKALFHRVLHFNELAGVDVIIVHRLLKNSVSTGQYLLLTEAAMRELQFPEAITFKPSTGTYEDIGQLKTAYHDFDLKSAKGFAANPKTFGERYAQSWKAFQKLWLGPFTSRGRSFRNLPGISNRAAKVGFAVLTLLLTSFMLPVVPVLGIFRAFKPVRS